MIKKWVRRVIKFILDYAQIWALEIYLEWGGKDNKKWLMHRTFDGKFLQDFFDCENMEHYFGSLDKTKSHTYKITIEKVREEPL